MGDHCAAPGASGRLSAIPSSTFGLHLNDNQLQVAVGIRLGSPVTYRHTCVCGAVADDLGLHALACKHTRSRHARHTSLNKIISQALRAAGVPCALEPLSLSRSDGKRPDGWTLTPWTRGKCLIWDATCTHRLTPSYSTLAMSEGATVADKAE